MQAFTLDAEFPGGNIIVEKTVGNTVFLRQDLRDTAGDWFFWAFRVRGAAGTRLTFEYTGGDVFGARGPALSLDGGCSWQWLGDSGVDRTKGANPSFSYVFSSEAGEAYFAFCPLYTESNWDEFLARHLEPELKSELLCHSRAGRAVEMWHLGTPAAAHSVLFTCRHHACETMASYCLEGILDTALADNETGAWLRVNAAFAVVPFMDRDGVEAGDQGKNRRPYDHNRDYGSEIGDSIYPEVAALRRWASTSLGASQRRFVLDLHCPWIRGDRNEEVYFVGVPNQAVWARVTDFSRILEDHRCGPLPYCESNNLPFGEDWNVGANYGDSTKPCARWASEQSGIYFSASLEVPYANAGGAEVTPDAARALGRDIATALRFYLDGLS